MKSDIKWKEIQDKWIKRWNDSKIFEIDINRNKKKYFLTVAYPYPNSPQHIGHARTYTLADVNARYKRMKGYNVLFPMGFHYTGTPILAMAKRLESGDSDLISTFKNIYKVKESSLREFKEPIAIANYFHQEIKQGMINIGYSIDWRREFTTVDQPYNKFIEWQFRQLKSKGHISQGSHPVGWCPNDGNPVGQHDTIGDIEPEIGQYTLIKFRYDNKIIPTATLRPETIFGVTNIWLNPNSEYVEIEIDNEKWILTKEAANNIKHIKNTGKINSFSVKELIGKNALNPMTETEIPLLPASFVDPKNGTGIVMSVPAHAPYDFQALEDFKKTIKIDESNFDIKDIEGIKPIPVIYSEGYGEIPAKEIIDKNKIKGQNDNKLEEITAELYAHEFHNGKMNEKIERYANVSVNEAKEEIKDDMIKNNIADLTYYIMNSPVLCRCGTECVVRTLEKQWFINYGEQEWKERTRNCLDEMTLIPTEIKPEFDYTIGWLKEKACARKSGMGTALPWDKDWIIESLSDSVIYMAYYTISGFINNIPIKPEELTDELFDYVFLGKGDINKIALESNLSSEIIDKMRKEFEYFYPLDARHSGRDLVPNHLTFFTFIHSALFPKKLWPKGIMVNGSVLMDGKKMSKSFGNIIPLKDAVKEYGADPLRLAIMSTSELLQDADMSIELIKSFQNRLDRLYKLSSDLKLNEEYSGELELIDKWMLSRLHKSIELTDISLNNLRVRQALHQIVYSLDQDVQWYIRRTKNSVKKESSKINFILNEMLRIRIQLLSPFAPFFCEEIWETMGKSGFISEESWPKIDITKINPEAEESEDLIKQILDDTSNILRVTKIKPNKIIYFVAAEWKMEIYQKILRMNDDVRAPIQEIMKNLMKEPKFKSNAKEVSEFVKKIVNDISNIPKEIKDKRNSLNINEYKILCESKSFYKNEYSCEIEVYKENDESKRDPKSKASFAKPFKPAIFVE